MHSGIHLLQCGSFQGFKGYHLPIFIVAVLCFSEYYADLKVSFIHKIFTVLFFSQRHLFREFLFLMPEYQSFQWLHYLNLIYIKLSCVTLPNSHVLSI